MGAAIGRLTKRAEFLQVAASRRKWAAPGVVLQAMKRPDGGEGVRVGFTATRKLGGAVERNRARRRLRAAAQAILPVAAIPGHDYVLIARAGTLTRPWPMLLEDLRKAIEAVTSRRREGR